MKELLKPVYFRVADLTLTSPSLDIRYVTRLSQQLINGILRPDEVDPIDVLFDLDLGLLVVDGNHRTAAFKQAREPRILGTAFMNTHPSLIYDNEFLHAVQMMQSHWM